MTAAFQFLFTAIGGVEILNYPTELPPFQQESVVTEAGGDWRKLGIRNKRLQSALLLDWEKDIGIDANQQRLCLYLR